MQRKILSADGMLDILRKSFGKIADPRGSKATFYSESTYSESTRSPLSDSHFDRNLMALCV